MPVGDRYLTRLAILFSVLTLAAYSYYIQPWMFDDAFIYFRYAQNFVAGDGLVYNVGEKVEGYTSFLWLIFMASGSWFGADPVLYSKVLGIIFASGCILLLANSYRFIPGVDIKMSAAATLLFGSSGIFLPWAVSGVEVTMFTFLTLLQVLCYFSTRDSLNYKKFSLLGILSGLTVMTRPEGLIIFTLLAVDQLVKNIKYGGRSVLYLVVFFGITYLPYFIWRYAYYGFLFPNTYYAKVSWTIDQVFRGSRYLVKFGIPALLMMIPLIDPMAASGWIRNYRRLLLLPGIVVAYTVYIVAIGGDYMPGVRFFTPILPVICLLSAMTMLLIKDLKKATVIVALTVVYNILMLDFYYITPQIKNEKVSEWGKEVGLWLKGNTSADAVIATNTAGSIPYYSGLKTIDMLGLNDSHIAHKKMPRMGEGYAGHEKADGEYVLSRRPDYIQFFSSYGSVEPVFPSDKEIYRIPEFHKMYVLREITLPSGNRLWLYERRRELDRLPSADDSISGQNIE